MLGFGLKPVLQSSQINSCPTFLLMIRNFSQHGCHGLAARHGYKSCCHPVAVMILVMYVDNKGIQHNCEELGQAFEKFVVMAMKPGADLDSLSILDNPDNFVVHPYAAFILELSYVTLNNLPQLNSFRSYSTRSFSKQRLFISRTPDFWFHYLLDIIDRKYRWR